MYRKYLGKYNDLLLFLILIPIISTINYYLTYIHIRWDWYTYTTYFIDIAQGYMAWWFGRMAIIWLDTKIAYEKAFAKRIIIQIVLTNIVIQGYLIFITELINYFFGDGPLPMNFYTYNLFIFFIWILVVNGIYIGFYFHSKWHKEQSLRASDKKLRSNGFKIQLGKNAKHIPFEEIAGFYVDDKTSYLLTKTIKQFVIDSSLNKIGPMLPEELFFRLNRKFIIHRDWILGYKKDVNGKLIVALKKEIPLEGEQVVSRTTAPEFKRWLGATAQTI
ncbi:MAG: LytTR family DNA-binding domain-containing protein [Bacteroidota bacterium]